MTLATRGGVRTRRIRAFPSEFAWVARCLTATAAVPTADNPQPSSPNELEWRTGRRNGSRVVEARQLERLPARSWSCCLASQLDHPHPVLVSGTGARWRAWPCAPAAGAGGTAGNRADLPCATSRPRFPSVGRARRRPLSNRPAWRTGGRPARRCRNGGLNNFPVAAGTGGMPGPRRLRSRTPRQLYGAVWPTSPRCSSAWDGVRDQSESTKKSIASPPCCWPAWSGVHGA